MEVDEIRTVESVDNLNKIENQLDVPLNSNNSISEQKQKKLLTLSPMTLQAQEVRSLTTLST